MANDDFDSMCTVLTNQFEETFRSQSLAEIPGKIQETIKTNPSSGCAVALACAVLTVIEESPRSADPIILTLSRILSVVADVVLDDEDSDGRFGACFLMNISEFLANPMHELQYTNPKHTTVSQTNTLLVYALISACAIRYGVLDDSPVYPFVDFGLSMPITTLGDDQREVVILAACLQVVIAGDVMMKMWIGAKDGVGGIIAEVENEKKSIKYPSGRELLEVCVLLFPTTLTQTLNLENYRFSENKLWCNGLPIRRLDFTIPVNHLMCWSGLTFVEVMISSQNDLLSSEANADFVTKLLVVSFT